MKYDSGYKDKEYSNNKDKGKRSKKKLEPLKKGPRKMK